MELFLQELAKLGDRFYLAFVAADRWKLYLSGLGNTLAITLGAICISTVLGMLLCLMKISRYRILRGPAKAYIDVIRGIPVVVQLMFIYFVVLVTWTNKTAVGIIAFGLNSAAYTAEIFRSGIQGIPNGQREAARVLGYNRTQTFFKIIFPQMCKRVLPPVTNEVITLVKDTSLAFVLAYTEMFTIAKQVAAAQANILPLFVAGVFYYIFNLLVAGIMGKIENWMNYYQ